jgi:tRNA-2-methylthio-N6-dimethylallyladenosine synthase
MNRKHKSADYVDLVATIRKARPDMALSSDFIVGFPGESEADFEATLDLIAQIGFASAYSFKYSPRPGTPAADLAAQVEEPVKSARLARLQALLERQRQTFNRAMVGRVVDVLFEKPGRHQGQIAGKTPYQQAVHVDGGIDCIGQIRPVEIVAAGANSLFGRMAAGHAAREAPI